MYQNVLLRHKRLLIAAGAVILSAAPGAAQDPDCRDAIANAARKYSNGVMKVLQKCEEGVLKGKVTGPCPDAAASGAIADLAGKLSTKVSDSCADLVATGFNDKVQRCSGGTADGNRCVDDEDCEFPPITAGPEDGTCVTVDECPAFLNGTLFDGCDMPLANAADVANCIECATLAKVGSVVGTFYASLDPASTDSDDLKCQKEIGKRASKYFAAVEKALTKCERGVIGGAPGPCPDGDATAKIDGKLAKMEEKILAACGDAARLSRAIQPGKLYATAGRYGSCGLASAGTGQGLADLLECVAENSAACDVALATGSNACSTQLCGNGQVDPGETCDDSNTLADDGDGPVDICPPDCTTNTGCVSSGTVNVTVAFTSDVDLAGMTLVIPYNDDKVSLPGPGGADVTARLTGAAPLNPSGLDLEYGLRAVVTDDSFAGVPSGTVMTIQFDTCTGAPALTGADLGCMVTDASDATFATVNGATCTATVGP
jgi:cysteine-rich repeat protein